MNTITLTNLGTVNKNRVDINIDGVCMLSVWFSYETPVAFKIPKYQQMVSANEWSKTTGKLLNELEPDKGSRYPHNIVMDRLNKVLATLKLEHVELN